MSNEKEELFKNAKPMDEEFIKELKEKLNKRMKQVHKDYIRKARQAEIDASKVVLTD